MVNGVSTIKNPTLENRFGFLTWQQYILVMNKSKPVTLLSVILVLISGCVGDLSRTVKEGLPDTVDGYERVSWEFIQSVGGMAIGDPVYDRKDNQILLPLIHDFTGKSKITVDPVLSAVVRHVTIFLTEQPQAPWGRSWIYSSLLGPQMRRCFLLMVAILHSFR